MMRFSSRFSVCPCKCMCLCFFRVFFHPHLLIAFPFRKFDILSLSRKFYTFLYATPSSRWGCWARAAATRVTNIDRASAIPFITVLWPFSAAVWCVCVFTSFGNHRSVLPRFGTAHSAKHTSGENSALHVSFEFRSPSAIVSK